MPLLNYTTKVPVARTIATIHGLLVEAGARQIGTTYDDDGKPCGVAFSIPTVNGLRAFTLPVEIDRVMGVLQKDSKTWNFTAAQAERIGWRIIKDWLEAQLAIVATEMVTLDQVMLPYMRSVSGKTVYELYVEDQLPELGPPS